MDSENKVRNKIYPIKTTFMAKDKEIERKWYIVDAEGKTLGRLASEVAKVLSGKNKPVWTPHVDTGDYVIVVNADKVALTGRKFKKKIYFHHTGYLGGGKYASAGEWMNKYPERVIQHAVRGMLPKTCTESFMFTRLLNIRMQLKSRKHLTLIFLSQDILSNMFNIVT